MYRYDVELNFEFVGFIIFENKFKFIMVVVFKEFGDFNIGIVMVIGDNILIVISVVREFGMISEMVYCFYVWFVIGYIKDFNVEL